MKRMKVRQIFQIQQKEEGIKKRKNISKKGEEKSDERKENY